MSGWPVIYVDELIPDIKPNTRGLYHIGSKITQRLNYNERSYLVEKLEKKAEAAGVQLMAQIKNRIFVIGWTPK